MTSSYSKTSVFVFVRPHVNEKPAFSKLFTLESVYKKMLFCQPFTRVDGRPNRRKKFRFKKRRNLYHVFKFSLSCRCLLVIRFLQTDFIWWLLSTGIWRSLFALSLILNFSNPSSYSHTLESWFTNLEQTPLNRSQQLPAPYKRLTDEIKQKLTTREQLENWQFDQQ